MNLKLANEFGDRAISRNFIKNLIFVKYHLHWYTHGSNPLNKFCFEISIFGKHELLAVLSILVESYVKFWFSQIISWKTEQKFHSPKVSSSTEQIRTSDGYVPIELNELKTVKQEDSLEGGKSRILVLSNCKFRNLLKTPNLITSTTLKYRPD